MGKKPKTVSTIDPQIKAMGVQNFNRAMGVANQPFQGYSGPLAPQVPQAVGQAQDIARTAGAYQPQMVTPSMAGAASSGVYGAAPARGGGGLAMGARGAAPQPGAPAVGALQGVQGIEAYQNPYQSQVVDRTLADLDRFRQMATNQNASNANLSGAFGNDRLGVENALTNEGFANQAATALANLNQQGFNTSAGLLGQDKDRLLQNQQFNAGLKQQTNLANQQAGLQGQALNQGAGLDAARINLGAAGQLGQLGGLEFGMQQAGTDAAYQEFLRQQNQPYLNQQLLNQTLGGFGALSGTQQQAAPPTGGVLQGLGGLIGGVGKIAGLFNPATAPFAAAGLAMGR